MSSQQLSLERKRSKKNRRNYKFSKGTVIIAPSKSIYKNKMRRSKKVLSVS